MRAWGAAISSGHVCLGLAGWLLLGIPPWFFGGCALLTLGDLPARRAADAARAATTTATTTAGGGDGPDDPGAAVVAGVRARVPAPMRDRDRHLTASLSGA